MLHREKKKEAGQVGLSVLIENENWFSTKSLGHRDGQKDRQNGEHASHARKTRSGTG